MIIYFNASNVSTYQTNSNEEERRRMEFADLGAHCAYDLCKQQTFTPFHCEACDQQYCRHHRTMPTHECPALSKSTTNHNSDNGDHELKTQTLQSSQSTQLKTKTKKKKKRSQKNRNGLHRLAQCNVQYDIVYTELCQKCSHVQDSTATCTCTYTSVCLCICVREI